jgi:hypothetical protein
VASVIVSGFLGVPAVVQADAPPVNPPVTDDVRAHLLQAGAALTGHRASEYPGLEPGKTYYGYDPNSDTYWAAAALSGPKTFDAGVMLPDANSYMMFRESGQGGRGFRSALGMGPGLSCHQPATAHCPPAIHDLWQWMPGVCKPPR